MFVLINDNISINNDGICKDMMIMNITSIVFLTFNKSTCKLQPRTEKVPQFDIDPINRFGEL